MKAAPEGGLYGPGIVDCKGGVAVALLAMAALEAAGVSRPLRLILMPDEELSNRLTGPDGIDFLQAHARGCAAAFVCECGKRDEAVVERKGILKVRVDIRGRAAHAGMYYAEGISAVREAAYQIVALEEQSRPDAVTYNCGRISGGTAENVVPETCSYTVDVRFRSETEGESAMAYLRRVTETTHVSGAVSAVTILSRRSPMPRTEAGMALFDHLRETACAGAGGPPAAVERRRLGRGLYRGGRRSDGLRRGDDRLGLAQRPGAQRAGRAYPPRQAAGRRRCGIPRTAAVTQRPAAPSLFL
ncbi:MAG: M20/M25/M40 family metallo-hydrolase [Acutalibacteraceae bacterium]